LTKRILAVSGDPALRSRIGRVLAAGEGLKVVAEATDEQEAVRKMRSVRPDLVILDGLGTGPHARAAIARILAASPETKAVVVSSSEDPRCVTNAFAGGASAYVLEPAGDAELLRAVTDVASGRSYVDAGLAGELIAASARREAPGRVDGLTERQREVLRLLALGHTNHEIADALVLSVRTVETHRAHVMQKLELESRAQLVRFALEHGLLD
jgi:two-component system, NarL family, response regulator NreC